MEKYVDELYELVKKSYELNEVPIGALVIHKENIIGRGFNSRQSTNNVCGHAEIMAIQEAEKYLNDWRTNDCFIFVTLHPCSMCQSIIKEARIDKVFYLIDQENFHNPEYEKIYFPGNKKCEEISKIFNDFFTNLRS